METGVLGKQHYLPLRHQNVSVKVDIENQWWKNIIHTTHLPSCWGIWIIFLFFCHFFVTSQLYLGEETWLPSKNHHLTQVTGNILAWPRGRFDPGKQSGERQRAVSGNALMLRIHSWNNNSTSIMMRGFTVGIIPIFKIIIMLGIQSSKDNMLGTHFWN